MKENKLTVDVKEHNKLLIEKQGELEQLQHQYYALQKELEEIKSGQEGFKVGFAAGESRALEKFIPKGDMIHQLSFHKGCEEGERLAMEKVNVAMAKACCGEGCFDKADFYKELGLSEVMQ